MSRPRCCETRPVSGSSMPVITSSRVVLPSPLRPTMPIRSPTPTPSETSVSSGRTPYDLETRSRLRRLDIGHRVRSGDSACGDEYDVVRGAQLRGCLAGLVGGLAEEDAGRTGAGDDTAQRTSRLPRPDQLREVRPEVERRWLQVVVQGRGEGVRVARGERGEQRLRHRGYGGGV